MRTAENGDIQDPWPNHVLQRTGHAIMVFRVLTSGPREPAAVRVFGLKEGSASAAARGVIPLNESRWLSNTDPQEMLLFLRDRSERKRRLFACACCRRVWRLLDSNHRMAVEVAEKFADGLADEDERSAVAYLVDDDEVDYAELESPKRLAEVAASWAVQSDQECLEDGVIDPDTEDCAILAAQSAVSAVGAKKRETAAQCELLRDIFGNPFRQPRLKKSWRTTAVVDIASEIYDEHAFGRLPELAVALQEAGCDNNEVLEHCRNGGPHVRGCWVVDLVLGM